MQLADIYMQYNFRNFSPFSFSYSDRSRVITDFILVANPQLHAIAVFNSVRHDILMDVILLVRHAL